MQKIEIFKAGKRPDSNGNFTEIKVSQLAQAVTAYDPSLHEAPAVIGHPKDNAPAYAWVKGLSLEGDTLKAELTQIDPEFSEMVQMGRFKKISASFYLEDSPHNPKPGKLYFAPWLGVFRRQCPPARLKWLAQPQNFRKMRKA